MPVTSAHSCRRTLTGRRAIGLHRFQERPHFLGDAVILLMGEGRIEPKAGMFNAELPFVLGDTPLAEDDRLLALPERPRR